MTISIVIPTYKRVAQLKRLLLSIERQTYKTFEVIIVDDNSPNQDEYLQLVDEFRPKLLSLTFISSQKNMGAPHSRNQGILKAKYDYVALVDDDDEWLPQKLEKQMQLISSSKAEIVYTWTDVVTENYDVIHRYRSLITGAALKEILHDCFIPSPSIIVKKSALLEAGLFDEEQPSCQDWDMWTRVFKLGYSCDVVKEVLTLYHKHSGETVGTSPKAKQGFLRYYKKHFWSLLLHREWRHLIRLIRLQLKI